jgi:hypothetical protein
MYNWVKKQDFSPNSVGHDFIADKIVMRLAK